MQLRKCKRCGSSIILVIKVGNRCSDETCPFSDHSQECMAGWSGHPTLDPNPNSDIPCTCEGATK